jgi:hypothetical protein
MKNIQAWETNKATDPESPRMMTFKRTFFLEVMLLLMSLLHKKNYLQNNHRRM